MRHHRLLSLVSLAIMAAGTFGCSAEPRQTLNFDQGWKFHLGDAKDAQAPEFVDATWRPLSVPHDYAIEGPAVRTDKVEGPFDHASPAGDGGGYLDAGPCLVPQNLHRPRQRQGPPRDGRV